MERKEPDGLVYTSGKEPKGGNMEPLTSEMMVSVRIIHTTLH